MNGRGTYIRSMGRVLAGVAIVSACCALLPHQSFGQRHGPPPKRFAWRSTEPLIAPKPDASHASDAVKDPTIVFADGAYHVFMTTAGGGEWTLAYTSFSDWPKASEAPVVYLDRSKIGRGYRAAPQVFYFSPQKTWYLIYQGGDPLYSTTRTISDPLSWSAPKPFFQTAPKNIKRVDGNPAWLDFWVICDERSCYLFNTDDAGNLYRSETALSEFPLGFGKTKIVMHDPDPRRLFEASMTYRIGDTGKYVTMVEAQGPDGRYFRSWLSNSLDGPWRPLADTIANPFAGEVNVSFPTDRWAYGISHGELIRRGVDQTMTIDPCKPLSFLFQGVAESAQAVDYIKLPYRLGLLTSTGKNAITSMCTSRR